MILLDTSIWADHLRFPDPTVEGLLRTYSVLCHPFVIGEIMMGNPKNRAEVLEAMKTLPSAEVAEPEEVLDFVQRRKLFGSGIGYVDAHLLTSVKLTAGARLWTRDRRMARVAEALDVVILPPKTH